MACWKGMIDQMIDNLLYMMIGLNPGPRARTVKPGPRHLRNLVYDTRYLQFIQMPAIE